MRVLVSGDGRGDERQYAQRSQAGAVTSHAFSLVFAAPSIHLALPGFDPAPEKLLPADCLPAFSLGSIYERSAIMTGLRDGQELERGEVRWEKGQLVCTTPDSWRLWSGARKLGLDWDEGRGVRVWSIPGRLEEQYMGGQEHSAVKRRFAGVDVDGGDDAAKLPKLHLGQGDGEGDGQDEEAVQHAFAGIKAPMAYQRLGKEVYRDPEPQSHRAQYPWLLAHQRENLDNIKELLATVVDPQVEELRSYNLVANEVLDMRTEYYSVEGTGELESCWVDGKVVSWERKRVVLVTREEGRTGHLGAVPVRRTARARGDMAGRGGDQARLEDLGKPILIVCQPCGHLQSIAVDLNMSGLDTKMIRLMNQRTGSYCYLCTATMQEAHDVTRVRRGFQADLSMEQLLKLAAELMETAGVPKDKWSEHVLLAEKGDANIRFGIKRFPLSTVVDSTRPYAVLHTTLLRAYAFCETLIIRYNISVTVMCSYSTLYHAGGRASATSGGPAGSRPPPSPGWRRRPRNGRATSSALSSASATPRLPTRSPATSVASSSPRTTGRAWWRR